MFTGIVRETGEVLEITRRQSGASIRIKSQDVIQYLNEGSSVAVNGVCLTVTGKGADWFAADLSPETLNRTTLGDLKPAALVNLEPPLSVDDRLEGHIVQGHVDGRARVSRLEPAGDGNYWLEVELAEDLAVYCVEKGSIAIDGISLTIARIEGCKIGIAIIPYTYTHTNLKSLGPGDQVNVEVDIIGKYVSKLLEPYLQRLRAVASSGEV